MMPQRMPGVGQKRQIDGMGRVGAPDYSVEFTPPESLQLKGESGDARVTWRRKPDGRVCIDTFDGVSLTGGDTEPDEDDEDEDDEEMEYA